METNDLHAALEVVTFKHDPEHYQPVIRRWLGDNRAESKNLFTWRWTEDAVMPTGKWEPCTMEAKDLLRGEHNPPASIWTCHDWISGETTYADEVDVDTDLCSTCIDKGTCSGPVEYLRKELNDLSQIPEIPLETVHVPAAEDAQQEVLVPKTLGDAVRILIQDLCDREPENVTKWMEMDEEKAITQVHHFFGRNLRNEWKLWFDSPLVRYMHEEYGVSHADDLSSILTKCMHREMNNLPWDIEGQAKYYRDYWDKKGGQPKPPWECKK